MCQSLPWILQALSKAMLLLLCPLRSTGAMRPCTGVGGLMLWNSGSRMERFRALRLKQIFLRLEEIILNGLILRAMCIICNGHYMLTNVLKGSNCPEYHGMAYICPWAPKQSTCSFSFLPLVFTKEDRIKLGAWHLCKVCYLTQVPNMYFKVFS